MILFWIKHLSRPIGFALGALIGLVAVSSFGAKAEAEKKPAVVFSPAGGRVFVEGGCEIGAEGGGGDGAIYVGWDGAE